MVLAQKSETSTVPLNRFITLAQSAAGVITSDQQARVDREASDLAAAHP
jgi:hypothetical protein